jgi:hypothetical protein
MLMQNRPLEAELQFYQSTLGSAMMAAVPLLACAALVTWAQRRDRAERWTILAAAVCAAMVGVLFHPLAVALGWWGGAVFKVSPLTLAAIILLWPTVLFALCLMGYRWLKVHQTYPRLLYGLALLVIFVPLTVVADLYALSRGWLTFGGGYTTAWDVLYVQAVFWLPVLFYEAIRRRHPWGLPSAS